MASILIADAHAVTRAGYRGFLAAAPAVTVVGEAASSTEVFACMQEKSWDLLLLDIQLGDCAGMGVLLRVRVESPGVRVLMVSGLPEEAYALAALRAGACGFISKTSALGDLLKAVSVVLGRRRYFSDQVLESLGARHDPQVDQPLHSRLSKRELQVFCKVARGLGVTAIGQELGVSRKTVSTYQRRIFDKMRFTSKTSITTYALRNGLLPL
jgi:two-component system invasion response regulator UvrY